jgi:hypothetical protein
MYKFFTSNSGDGERFTYSNDYSWWSNNVLSRWIGDIDGESFYKLRMEQWSYRFKYHGINSW